ncbi:MAG TPA: hypothetical protein VHM23_23690 [Actinomycetota bacterium]|nr:hypothetical protein [Actinomycetota bacterium]
MDLPFDTDQTRVIRFDHTDLASANRCRQALVGAHRVEYRLTELLDSLKETLRAPTSPPSRR